MEYTTENRIHKRNTEKQHEKLGENVWKTEPHMDNELQNLGILIELLEFNPEELQYSNKLHEPRKQISLKRAVYTVIFKIHSIILLLPVIFHLKNIHFTN